MSKSKPDGLANMVNLYGLCECGCGGFAPIARQTETARGAVKGHPIRFINGHNNRRGGRYTTDAGYVKVKFYGHPRADKEDYVCEHILVAEAAIGRQLQKPIEVHHVNERKADNRNSNLVVCEDNAYHCLLHRRMRAYQATGSVLGVKCSYCKQWDLPINPDVYVSDRVQSRHHYHRSCMREFFRERTLET